MTCKVTEHDRIVHALHYLVLARKQYSFGGIWLFPLQFTFRHKLQRQLPVTFWKQFNLQPEFGRPAWVTEKSILLVDFFSSAGCEE